MGNEFLFINGIIPNVDFLRTNDKNSLLVSSDLYQKSFQQHHSKKLLRS